MPREVGLKLSLVCSGSLVLQESLGLCVRRRARAVFQAIWPLEGYQVQADIRVWQYQGTPEFKFTTTAPQQA